MLGVFEMLGNLCQSFGDLARDSRRNFCRIEFLRIEPDQAQPLVNLFLPELFEIDTKPLPVGKLRVVFPWPVKSA